MNKDLKEIWELVEGFEEDEDPKDLYDRLEKIKEKILERNNEKD